MFVQMCAITLFQDQTKYQYNRICQNYDLSRQMYTTLWRSLRKQPSLISSFHLTALKLAIFYMYVVTEKSLFVGYQSVPCYNKISILQIKQLIYLNLSVHLLIYNNQIILCCYFNTQNTISKQLIILLLT